MAMLRWRSLPALLLVALVAQAGRADDTAAAKAAAERDARALGWLIQRGVQVLAQPAAPAAEPQAAEPQAAEPQIDEPRRQQIEQHAKAMKPQFRLLLNAELELIRRTCGGLAPEARQQILAAGSEATAAAARGLAERQFTGRLGKDFDPQQEIRGRLEQALAPLADPAALAAYRQEVARREARRAESARVAIVACIDGQLQLSAEQRSLIDKELERTWQAAWIRELVGSASMQVNGLPLAPDYAAEAIEPHLKDEQAAAWKKWRRMASARNMGRHFHPQFDGLGLQQPDPWWGK